MDKLKLIIKIFVFSCLFILLSPIVIQFIVTTPSSFGFITPETQDTWINFFGAIIGGGATLLGVWWTIKDAESKRKEDMYVSHKPFLEVIPKTAKYAPNDFHFNSKWKMNIYIKSDDESSHFIAINNDFLTTIKLKNVGLGIAKNIIFTDFNYNFTEIQDINSSCDPENLPYELNITYLYKIPYLSVESAEEIPIIFLIDNNYENSLPSLKKIFKNCTLNGSIKICYCDSYNNWFSQKMNFNFILDYHSNEGILIYIDFIYLEDSKAEDSMQELMDIIYQNNIKEQFKSCE